MDGLRLFIFMSILVILFVGCKDTNTVIQENENLRITVTHYKDKLKSKDVELESLREKLAQTENELHESLRVLEEYSIDNNNIPSLNVFNEELMVISKKI